MSSQTFKKVLVANRGEIAIRIFRACTELGMRTVAIYSKEDSGSYHRYKADEAYLVGEGKKPIDAYLDIEGIILIAKQNDIDAIHPGYGFLSENIHFAKRCQEENIVFIGPNIHHLHMFGDKVRARQVALDAGLPVIPGTGGPVSSLDELKAFANEHGYPIIIKASLGGGGRGMRIVTSEEQLAQGYHRAQSEAKSAFGEEAVYAEKFIEKPKHIEVQIMADTTGNIVHLFERDCSVQRRHQKVVEVAPSVSLSPSLRKKMCDAAVEMMRGVAYVNAGTVEFLVTQDEQFYFIEVNPRIQVEHTITEMVTGVDIVQSQLLIAQGFSLHDEVMGIPKQTNIVCHGYAIQCRVTTEDPAQDFMPDTGKITVYRSGGGFGVRLDAGNGFQGAVITPYYDSLLVKLSTWALTFEQAAAKMLRNLKEFRIRGIKTNIEFLENVVTHPSFLLGKYDTSFIDVTKELFLFPKKKDRGTKMLHYIAATTINGFPGLEQKEKPHFPKAQLPFVDEGVTPLSGTKQVFDAHGARGVVDWIQQQTNVLLTDTTFRDAHQSLLATRVRTHDLVQVAKPTAMLWPTLFSLETWGGATFDVAYRFLNEDPWERLVTLRQQVPNLLFQMLLRASNAVGYKNYPDNVVEAFIEQASEAGIDVFRIFDSLNGVDGMKVAIDAVRANGKMAEASICYTGDILNTTRLKYTTAYYVAMAKQLEASGAHILGIKDMAGLLKPEAAYVLISTLKDAVSLPIHLHTHDTSGNGIYTYAKAIDAGVDIVDVAVSSMAGGTSQPSANSLLYALSGHKRQPIANHEHLQALSTYWEGVRTYYQGFDSQSTTPDPQVYEHEMPGGQLSNLKQQAKAVGLGERFEDVKKMYRTVNDLFGDVVKVTPSSKVVGDMALFMVQNNLSARDIEEKGATMDFPDSVVAFFKGEIGQPYGGFPKQLQKLILKNQQPLTVRPGEQYKPVDFTKQQEQLEAALKRQVTMKDVLSYILYPKVFLDREKLFDSFGDLSVVDTPTFFYGMRLGEEIEIEIERGKTLIVKLVSIGEPHESGMRVIYFELNGQHREVLIKDESVHVSLATKRKANPSDEAQIGATMPGTVLQVMVRKGQRVKKGDVLMITEAMKMETTVQSPFDGEIKDVYVTTLEAIATGDLLVELIR
ncbi:pyruvate carboxylase [Fictibacillus macauensis ZFHKF-1]|uniref:Pyruvate carboxylase n=1 Tax=Fictibacillus macauensis ZFHKF-1 TaxID=1196324 RepID=I8UDP5_9BACL|nr:pyruvate carboxylase [Fictibacillus macauensis]EIT84928.1 pyruvate carboxylase [Fictibacillus macauensis ZFHKF-1]